MSTTATTAVALPTANKNVLGKLLSLIGGLIAHLLNGAKSAFNEMAPAQQQATINGTQISQIIKNGYAKGEAWILSEITKVTGLPADIAKETVLSLATDSGVKVSSVQAFLDNIASTVQAGITDNKWNALWQDFAQFGASYLTQGKLDWVTLSLGIIEYAFQTYVAGKL